MMWDWFPAEIALEYCRTRPVALKSSSKYSSILLNCRAGLIPALFTTQANSLRIFLKNCQIYLSYQKKGIMAAEFDHMLRSTFLGKHSHHENEKIANEDRKALSTKPSAFYTFIHPPSSARK
ncbi:hypothetical protein ABF87_00175 [Nitrosomonas sp. JL21]|nr:hypothetical protein [Nitrosomonas sp. JL21]